MGTELEGLEFQIEALSENSEKSVDKLAASFKRLKNAVKGGLGATSTINQLQKLKGSLSGFHTERLEKLGNALQAFQNVGTLKIPASFITQIERLNDALKGMDNVGQLVALSNALKSFEGIAEIKIQANLASRITDLATVSQQLTPEGISNLYDLGNALQNIAMVGDVHIPRLNMPTGDTGSDTAMPRVDIPVDSGMEDVSSSIEEATEKVSIFRSVLSGLGNIVSGLGGVFNKTFGIMKSIGAVALGVLGKGADLAASGVKKLCKEATLLPVRFGSHLASKIKQTTSGLGQLFSSLKRVAMYRLIRTALKEISQGFSEGISNLYQYSDLMGTSFAKSMDSLATSSLYLKNSLGAMVSPLINALAPAIDFVVDKFVDLLNIINQVFAKLTGNNTYTAAKKLKTTWGDAADGVKKAADEIKRYTLGFDELNILGKNKGDSGSGSGGNGSDYGSMFEELPIDSSIGDFASRLREAFENGDWQSLGTILGDKVNEGVNSIDWSGIGSTIGYGINSAVKTAYYFLDAVDFKNIGSKIAEFLNSALKEIDFEFVGRLLIKPFTSLADLIIGAVTTIDWVQVARSISNCVKGIFNEASEWLDSVDWENFGETLWQDIKDVFTNIDYAGLAKSFFTFLGKAIRSAAQFLVGFFGSIAEDIKKWWNKDIQGADWKETAENLLKAIGKGFVNIGNFVINNIIDPFAEALLGKDKWDRCKDVGGQIRDVICEDLVNAAFWVKNKIITPVVDAITNADWFKELESVGGDVIDGLLTGIGNAFKSIGTWIKEHIIDPFVTAVKDHFDIHSPSKVMAKIGGYVIEGFLNGILKPFKAISTWVKDNIFTPLSDAIKNSSIPEFAVKVKNTAAEWWNNVKTWWSDKVSDVKDFAVKVKNDADTWWSNVKSWWTGKVGAVSEFTTSVKNTSSTWWSNVKSWWANTTKDGVSLSALIKLAKSGWTTIIAWIGSIPIVSQTIGLAKKGWSTVKSWVGSIPKLDQTIGLAKSGWTKVSDWVKKSLGTSISIGVSLFKSGWSSLKSFIGLANGGSITSNGMKFFSSGGAIGNGFSEMWNSIPKYSKGTANAHGTMFVAGEAGAEVVGHVNGRTEVLNKSQLGQIMHRSIVDGMAQFAGYWKSVNTHMTTCANAQIAATLVSAEMLYRGLEIQTNSQANYSDWINELDAMIRSGLHGEDSADAIAEGVRTGVYEATARQNDLLREQNDLLRQILNKDTSVEVTANSFAKAINRKNQRDGKTVIPVST